MLRALVTLLTGAEAEDGLATEPCVCKGAAVSTIPIAAKASVLVISLCQQQTSYFVSLHCSFVTVTGATSLVTAVLLR
jgi:hypothetical protein